MTRGYFGKLAIGNLRKNMRFYLPYILTQAGLLACFYIILTLAMDDRLHHVKGGSYIPTFMFLGVIIMVILSTILIFYMNSFLMKQRKHEFGLYNILGMEKKHVCRILWMETVYSNGVSLLLGLLTGILFYKLSTLLICRLLQVDTILGFYYIKPLSILPSLGFFLALDLFLYLVNAINIHRMKPVELLASKKAGEKEPKTNWLLFLPGLAALGFGYYLAISCRNPLEAFDSFFTAVILVIIGTYFLFVAGSIWLLRTLKASRNYYYQKNHMIGVSGLLYRMKQNAVGLASITILACGVLVMVSSTISLYAGTEDSLKRNYHSQIMFSANYNTEDGQVHPLSEEELTDMLTEIGAEHGLTIKDAHMERYLEVTYVLRNQELVLMNPDFSISNELVWVTYLSEEQYEKMTGEQLSLAGDEIALCPYSIKENYEPDTLKIGQQNYRITKRLDYFPIAATYNVAIVPCYGIVLPSEVDFQTVYEAQHAFYEYPSECVEHLALSYQEEISNSEGADLMAEVFDRVHAYISELDGATGAMGMGGDNVWEAAINLYGVYGALFFLGMILGFVFLFATALIIYYKQISEGYEDRERFQIMARIGLAKEEAKKAISSQILLVFFLPLIVSGIHLAVAFPLLKKMLMILQLGNPELFAKCTLLAYIGFAIIYTGIYEMTAKIYYRIVS